jgi:hypothetical protein
VAYVARWAEVASDQYWELAEPVRQLVDERVRILTEVPDGPFAISIRTPIIGQRLPATAGSCSCTSFDRSSRGCSSSDWWCSDLALAPYASVAGTVDVIGAPNRSWFWSAAGRRAGTVGHGLDLGCALGS